MGEIMVTRILLLLATAWLTMLVSCSSIAPNQLVDLSRNAHDAHARGDWPESLRSLAVIENTGLLSEADYLLKAQNLIRLERFSEAHGVYHEALERRPHSKKIPFALAQWHFDYGLLEEARLRARDLVQLYPRESHLRKLLAQIYMREEQWRMARVELETALVSSPDDESLSFLLGQTIYKLGSYADAVAPFSRAFEGQEFKDRSAEYLAWIHSELRQPARANPYIRHLFVAKKDGPFTQKLFTKNLLQIPAVDKVSVLKEYNSKFDDDWGKQQYWLALRETGMGDEALDYLAELWNTRPSTYWVASNYARELNSMGRTEVATRVLKRSMLASSGTDTASFEADLSNLSDTKAAAPSPQRSLAAGGLYRVRPGDTLQLISQRFFGTTKRWRAIAEKNASVLGREGQLRIGSELTIPGVP